MSAVHLISDRIGADNVERHMSFAIQKVFSTFSVIYEKNGIDGGIRMTTTPPKQVMVALFVLHLF